MAAEARHGAAADSPRAAVLPPPSPSVSSTSGRSSRRRRRPASEEGGEGTQEAAGSVDGEAARRRRRRSTSAAPSQAPQQPSVLEMIEEELGRLRPGVEEQAARSSQLVQELAEARSEEFREKRLLRKNRAFRQERAQRLAMRMQACIRGWLVRKRVVVALNKELAAQAGVAACMPDQLRDQLRDLKHTVHELKYQPDHRHAATVRLQAWWRGFLARRVVAVLRVAKKMREVYHRMSVAATKLSAWYRAISTRLRYRDEIRARMRETFDRQMEEMALGLQTIIKLQRAFRAKLALRRLEAFREAFGSDQLDDESEADADTQVPTLSLLVDSWRPGGLTGDPAGDQAAAIAAAASAALGREQHQQVAPRSDRELERLEAAGLVPFYWSSSQDLVRHRIGGSQAVRIQRQLRVGEAVDWQLPSDDVLESMGGFWDVYPEGLSADFLEGLDEDAWPWPNKGRAKKQRRKPPRKKVLPAAPPPPPSNAEKRAAKRDQVAVTAAEKAELTAIGAAGQLGGEEAHPLFVNAPPLLPRLLPAPPPGPPPRGAGGRRPPPLGARAPKKSFAPPSKAAFGGEVGDDDEGSWGGARSFSYCPSAPSAPSDLSSRLFGGGRPISLEALAARSENSFQAPLAIEW